MRCIVSHDSGCRGLPLDGFQTYGLWKFVFFMLYFLPIAQSLTPVFFSLSANAESILLPKQIPQNTSSLKSR